MEAVTEVEVLGLLSPTDKEHAVAVAGAGAAFAVGDVDAVEEEEEIEETGGDGC